MHWSRSEREGEGEGGGGGGGGGGTLFNFVQSFRIKTLDSGNEDQCWFGFVQGHMSNSNHPLPLIHRKKNR